jgi:hypothetical protein
MSLELNSYRSKAGLFNLKKDLISPEMGEMIENFRKALVTYKRTIVTAEKFKRQLQTKTSPVVTFKDDQLANIIKNYELLKL